MAPVKKRAYGPALAEQVAEALLAGRRLAAYHRDYCGLGLEYRRGTFFYGEVWDGQLQQWSTIDDRPGFLLTFPDRAAFVAWLGAQSDTTLSRREMPEPFYHDNQTITRGRLKAFVADLPWAL